MNIVKKIAVRFGYFTWFICNISVLYFIGEGFMFMTTLSSVKQVVLYLALGTVLLFIVMIMSYLLLGLIAMFFNDEKLIKQLEKIEQ